MQTQSEPVQPSPPIRTLIVTVVEGPDEGASLKANDDRAVSVGTAEHNQLRVTDPLVSRYHIELAVEAGGVLVQDLGSKNGSFVGEVRLRQGVIPIGSRVRIGKTILQVEDGDAVSAQPEAAELPGFVAVSHRSRRVVHDVTQIAPSAVSVLLRGETGTGKEVVARALHALSDRAEGPFVVVDCGSMPATLIASELFGHERGAFTSAERKHIGAFERAAGGTIFLDEIGELPLAVQPALLGVLERRVFRRVGGESDIAADTRVVAATHRDLRAAVNDGTFRADLYYRIAVARVRIPPLRERTEDIPELVRHFAREARGSDELPFGAEVLAAMSRHPWTGNVRELRNVVESALAMGRVKLEDTASVAHVVDTTAPADRPLAAYRDARAEVLDRFERDYLTRLIESCEGNASEASRRARMDRNYLVSLLKKHGLR